MTPKQYSIIYKKLSQKKPPAKIYLYGDAQLLKEGIMHGVRKPIEGIEDFNLDTYWMSEQKGSDAHKRIFDSMISIPMLGDRRIVILRNFSFSKSLEKKILEALKNFQLPDFTILLIDADKLDARTKIGKIVVEKFDTVELNTPSDREMMDWATYFASKLGKRLARNAASELIRLSGISLSALREEIRKLSDFIDGDIITLADVRKSAPHSRSAHIFQFSNAFAKLDFATAMRFALELMDFGEKYSSILFWMNRNLTDLFWASVNPQQLSKRLGRRAFLADSIRSVARKITPHKILGAMEKLHRADMLVKTGSADDKTAIVWAIASIENDIGS